MLRTTTVLCIAIVVLGLPSFGAFPLAVAQTEPAPDAPESPGREGSGREESGPEAGDLSLAARSELRTFFVRLGRRAAGVRGAPEFATLFDAERFGDEVARQHLLVVDQIHADLATVLRRSAGRAAEVMFSELAAGWDRHVIGGAWWCEPGEKSGEASVYVQIRLEDETRRRVRFWLRRHADRWRCYDWKDLDAGMRLSTRLGLAALPTEGVEKRVVDANRLAIARRALEEEDFDVAIEQLTSAAGTLPPELETLRRAQLALALLRAEQFAAAMELLESSDDIDLSPARLDGHMAVGEWQSVVDTASPYLEHVTADATAAYFAGLAYANLGELAAALNSLQRAVGLDPDDYDLVASFGRLLPDDKKERLAECLRWSNDARALFEPVARVFMDANDAPALEAWSQAYLDQKGADADGYYYLAQASLLRGDLSGASERAALAVPLVKGDEAIVYYRLYFFTMLKAGRVLDAYDGPVPKSFAFSYLGDHLLALADEGELPDVGAQLRKLLAKHRENVPDDPWDVFFEAESYLRDQEFAKAMALFSKGYAASEDDVRDAYRNRGIYAAVLGGDVLQAYRTYRPQGVTFDQLGWLLSNRRDRLSLESLVAARKKDAPDSSLALFWEAEVSWLAGDYAECAARLGALEKREPDDSSDQLSSDHADRLEFRLVRSLCRSGQFSAARAVAEASTARDGDPYFELLVAAMRGDAEAARPILLRCLGLSYTAESLLEDEDLGPALASPELASLRPLLNRSNSTGE